MIIIRKDKHGRETYYSDGNGFVRETIYDDRFKEFADSILPVDIDRVKTVNIEQY